MPKKVAKKDTPKSDKKEASKPIKKSEKDSKSAKKAGVDKAVKANSLDAAHYILILDDSGSMAGKPWADLESASSDFLKSLSSSKKDGDKISCIIYNTVSKVVFENQVPDSKLSNKI